MAGLAELLGGGSDGGIAPYLAENPYFIAGNNLKVAAPPASILGKGAMWTSALQNLLSGVLQGYGRREANRTAYEEYAQDPMLKNASRLKAALADSGVDTSSMLNTDYSSSEVPRGWSPRVGAQDRSIAGALMAQEIERAAAERKLQLEAAQKIGIERALIPVEQEKQRLLAPLEIAKAGQIAGAQESARVRAEANALGYNPKQKDLDIKVAEAASNLRKEIAGTAEGQSLSQTIPIFDAIQKGALDDSVSGDINLVSGAAKIIDPTGSVREGDVKLQQGAGGPWGQLSGELAAWNGKGKLRPEVRAKVLEMVHTRLVGMTDQFNRRIVSTLETANRYNLPKSEVVPFQIPDYANWKNPLVKFVPTGKTDKNGNIIVK